MGLNKVVVADIFFPMPNGVNPAGNFFIGIANLIIGANLLIQLAAPSITVSYFIFFAEPYDRLHIPRKLVLPAAAIFGPGAAILLMLLFGIWWSFLLNVIYCIAGSIVLHTIVVPKSRELYASGAITKIEERINARISSFFGAAAPADKVSLGPIFQAKVQEPFTNAAPILGGVFGLIGFMIPFGAQAGEPWATLLVLSFIFFFSWAIPLGVHGVLNAPDIHNYVRVPLLAVMLGYYFSATMQTGIFFLPALLLAGGYFWWWYNRHPWMKMKFAHDRCKALHAATTVQTAQEFAEHFKSSYCEKWGFEPSARIIEVATQLFEQNAPTEIPPLPELPPFQPSYSTGQDIRHQLQQLETTLKAIPQQQETVRIGITSALNTYTAAVPRPDGFSVFTVAAREMVPDLPALVHALGISFPNGFAARTRYERNRDAVSQEGLGVKAYESGGRIDPEAYANA